MRPLLVAGLVDPDIIYALDLGDPNSLTDDVIMVTRNATQSKPKWEPDPVLTKLATGNGRYRLACGDGAPGAPPAATLNWGENHGYRYECSLNQVVFSPDHPELRFAIMSAGVAFTRDAGKTWISIEDTINPLGRPIAAVYDPTSPSGTLDTDLYVGLRGHGVIRIRSHFNP